MNYLFSVFWKDYHIGSVYKEDKNFYYLYQKNGVVEAKKEGFDFIVGFPDIDEIYVADSLFPFFKSRITNEKREKDKFTAKNPMGKLLESEGKLITDYYRMVKEKTL